jgi:hypothetical protein
MSSNMMNANANHSQPGAAFLKKEAGQRRRPRVGGELSQRQSWFLFLTIFSKNPKKIFFQKKNTLHSHPTMLICSLTDRYLTPLSTSGKVY